MESNGQLRGMQRILAREVHVSDLLQHLSDLDSQPWKSLVGFAPSQVGRERPLARLSTDRKIAGDADLVLISERGEELLVEVKLGHNFSVDQQERYERSSDGRLILAGLASDKFLIRSSSRWEYLNLVDIFDAWRESPSQEAAVMARSAVTVIKYWDEVIRGVFDSDDGKKTLDVIHQKFLAIVIARNMADQLEQRGWDTFAGTSSGSGGTAIVQTWAPIRGDDNRCLIAEIRWGENTGTGVLRLGIDYSGLSDSVESRAEAWDLANAMDEVIRIDVLRTNLAKDNPLLEALLTRSGAGRKVPANDNVWRPVVNRGFYDRVNNPQGVAGGRIQNNPGFAGDRTLRFQAVSTLDFSKASATDLIELVEASLRYLQKRLPDD